MATQQVIIEFSTDTSALDQAQQKQATVLKGVNDQLKTQAALSGNVTTEVSKEQAAYNKLLASIKSLTGESKKAVEAMLTKSPGELAKAFDQVGVSVDDYIKTLKSAEGETKVFNDTSKNSRTRLREMREALILLTQQGKTNTQQFKDIQAAAGRLSDTIGDVGRRIKDTGSDTRVFDGLISAAQGVAGGFAVAQGAAALFGDESGQLQETLLKVNAAMAVLQGLQQIQNVLQKESAASLLFLNNQRKVEVATTEIQTVAQSENTIAKGAALLAQRALSTAMALSNPITLAVVAAITALTAVYKFFTGQAEKAADAQKNLNLRLEQIKQFSEDEIKAQKDADEILIAEARNRGATEKQIRDKELRSLQAQLDIARRVEDKAAADAAAAQEKRRKSTNENEIKRLEDTQKTFEEFQKRRQDLEQQRDLKVLDNIKRNSEEQTAIRKKAIEEQIQAEKERLEQAIAGLKIEQSTLEDTSGHWVIIQEDINKLEGQLASLGLTGNKAILAMGDAVAKNAEALKNIFQTVGEVPKSFTDAIKIEGEKQLKTTSELGIKLLNTEKKINKQSLQDFVKSNLQKIEFALQTAEQIGQIASEIFKQQSDSEQARIDEQRRNVDDLLAAGAITAKEAAARQKKLDAEERRIKQQAAQRDKSLAIFNAIINTAQAITKALADTGPIGAAIAGALGAAQIALIASRPIPKFGKGKKSAYEGLAEVGEIGPELVKRGNKMELIPEKKITWLAKEDKVFNPAETMALLERPQMRSFSVFGAKEHAKGMDYDRMGKSIAKHLPQFGLNVDEDGFKTWVQQGLNFTKYLDKRRSFSR